MSFPKVNVRDLKASAKDFDFVRFTWPDINGISRSKTITGCYVDRFIEDGIGCYNGTVALGPQNEISTIPLFPAQGNCNIYAKPVVDCISELPWLNENDTCVGEMLCEPVWLSGKVQEGNPRYVARKQLEQLESMGLKIYSASEVEFVVADQETLKPISSGNEYVNTFTYSKHAKMFQQFNKNLKKMGVDVETFQSEFGPGQFEFTFDPKYGIESVDMIFKFKEAMKEMCHQKGLHATFMTRPFATHGCSNGTHFNFSLWNGDGKNVLYDSAKPDKFSDLGRHFIGGILKHAKALTALCSPTANCYRRLHTPFAPNYIDWGIDNRNVMIRVKNNSENGTYIENRMPSGSCNPYMAQAATIAAGIDGMVNKIEPPKMGEGDRSTEQVPHTLQEALDALQADEYMKEALGKQFVEWFISVKTNVDIAKFGKHDIKSQNEEEMEAERQEYFMFM